MFWAGYEVSYIINNITFWFFLFLFFTIFQTKNKKRLNNEKNNQDDKIQTTKLSFLLPRSIKLLIIFTLILRQ
jgi:hypothetical protein